MVAGAAVSGAAQAAAPEKVIVELQEWSQGLGEGVDARPYGVPSKFESGVVRHNVEWLTASTK